MLNTAEVTLGGDKFLVVDLTEPLRLDVEVYPGDPKPKKEVFAEIGATEYQHHIYHIGDHNFHPHGDAPKHQNPEIQNQGFEIYGVKDAFSSACLINLSDVLEARDFDGIKYLVEVKKEHLEPFAEQISQKEAVIVRTGYDLWLKANRPHEPLNIPYLNKDAAEFLSRLGNLKVVGIDSITVDVYGRDSPVHVAHQTLKDKLIVESLVNLNLIPESSRNNFDLQTTAIRIEGATGGPVVAYAYIKL